MSTRELSIPSTIPKDFDEKLEKLAIKGLRILAISYKDID